MAVFSGNGSAASPSFTFSSDTDLGIYRSGTDQLSFTTSGTERVRFKSDGSSEFYGLVRGEGGAYFTSTAAGNQFVITSGSTQSGTTNKALAIQNNQSTTASFDYLGGFSTVSDASIGGTTTSTGLVRGEGGAFFTSTSAGSQFVITSGSLQSGTTNKALAIQNNQSTTASFDYLGGFSTVSNVSVGGTTTSTGLVRGEGGAYFTSTGSGNQFVITSGSTQAGTTNKALAIQNNGSTTFTLDYLGGLTCTSIDVDSIDVENEILAGPSSSNTNATISATHMSGRNDAYAVNTLFDSNRTQATCYGSFVSPDSGVTVTSLNHFVANSRTFSGSATSVKGFSAEDAIAQGTTASYGFYGDIADGTGKFNYFAQGTAPNYFEGRIGVGNTSASPNINLFSSGSASFSGSVSKGSGSFKIDHPLPSLTETHHLVHSFVEGPQADNIYRGQVDLEDGIATVNLDTAARMAEGTFVLLNTNISCFTSNESDWTAVRGSVTGNVLTIEAQDDTSTATVSWMVVGERHDQHMIDTEWTDENGRVITEPLKPVVEEAEEEAEEETSEE